VSGKTAPESLPAPADVKQNLTNCLTHLLQRIIGMSLHSKIQSGETAQQPSAKAEFMQIAGITPELETFINALVGDPEIFVSLPQEKRQQIESQMDSVLAQVCWK
jgi:hypothetical protein